MRKGTIQVDPTTMATYAIGLTLLLDDLQSISSGTKHVAFADDLTVAQKIISNQTVVQPFTSQGTIRDCYPKPAKSYIIVKHQYEQNKKQFFSVININFTVSGAKYLGVVIRSVTFE